MKLSGSEFRLARRMSRPGTPKGRPVDVNVEPSSGASDELGLFASK